MRPLHIVMWNIRFGGGSRLSEVLEVIAHHAPDIVVIAEFARLPTD